MNIAVFGASGQTGKLFVELALEAGHHVTALVRDPTKLGINHPHLQIVNGDALDKVAVEATVQESQVIVSTLGNVKGEPDDLLSASAENILGAMHIFGVRRLIVCAPIHARFEGDPRTFIQRVLAFFQRLRRSRKVKPLTAFINLIKASDFDWTIVRLASLTGGAKTGKVRHGIFKPGKTSVSRADAAAFLMDQLTDTTYIRKAPMLAD